MITQVATYQKNDPYGSVRIDKSEPLPDLSIRQEHKSQLELIIMIITVQTTSRETPDNTLVCCFNYSDEFIQGNAEIFFPDSV